MPAARLLPLSIALASLASAPYLTAEDAPAPVKPVQVPDAEASPSPAEVITVEGADGVRAEPLETANTISGVDRVRLHSPAPLVGVSREEFGAWTRNTHTGDIVDRMPGVFSGGDEHLGENKDTRLRGLRHGWTRMEYGGITLPDISPGRDFRLNKVSPLSVGSIIILRAPTAEYDSDGIAGRIILTPRPITDRPFVEAQAGYGVTVEPRSDERGNAYEAAVAAGTRVNDAFGFNLYGSADRTPVQSHVEAITRNTAGTITREVVTNEDKHWDNANVVADFGFRYGTGELRIRPMYLYQNEVRKTEALTTQTGLVRREVTDLDRPQSTYGATVDHAHRVSDDLRLEWDAHYYVATEKKYNDKDQYDDTGNGPVFIRTQSNERDITHWVAQVGAKAAWQLRTPFANEVKVGFQFRVRDFDSDYDKWETNAVGVVTDTTDWEDNFILRENYAAVFIQDGMALTDHLEVMLGLRYEYVDTETESTFNDTTGDSTTSDLNPSLHAVYRVLDGLNVRGSVARMVNRPGYRDMAPSETETATTITYGNPDLIPQTAWNYELGMEYGFGRSLIGATVFYKDIDDVIEVIDTGTEVDGKDALIYDNVGDGHVQGLELDQRLFLRDLFPETIALTIWLSETFLDGETTEKNTGVTRPFSDQSDFLFSAGIDYEIESTGTGFGVGAKYQGEAERITSDTDKTTTEGTWYLSAQAFQRIGKNARLTLSVDNLLDEEIEKQRVTATSTEDTTDAVGFMVRLGASVAF